MGNQRLSNTELYAGFWSVVLAAAVILMPELAWAQPGQAGGLETAVTGLGRGINDIPKLLSLISYTLGGVAIVMGGYKLKAHSDNPNQTPLNAGIIRLFAGSFLIGLPSVAAQIIATLGIGGDGVQAAISTTRAAAGAGPVALDVALQNFVAAMQGPLVKMIGFIAYIMGIYTLMKGMLKAIRFADDGPKGQPGMGILAHLVIGAALIAAPGLLEQVSTTLNMQNPTDFTQLSFGGTVTGDPADRANNAARAVLAFVQIIGLIGFVRGFNMLRVVGEGGNQQASAPAAFTHIIGGAMAWNIIDLIKMVETTVGLQAGSIIS